MHAISLHSQELIWYHKLYLRVKQDSQQMLQPKDQCPCDDYKDLSEQWSICGCDAYPAGVVYGQLIIYICIYTGSK